MDIEDIIIEGENGEMVTRARVNLDGNDDSQSSSSSGEEGENVATTGNGVGDKDENGMDVILVDDDDGEKQGGTKKKNKSMKVVGKEKPKLGAGKGALLAYAKQVGQTNKKRTLNGKLCSPFFLPSSSSFFFHFIFHFHLFCSFVLLILVTFSRRCIFFLVL
jgi:hypothetical protein